jgi:hypothetical protein
MITVPVRSGKYEQEENTPSEGERSHRLLVLVT